MQAQRTNRRQPKLNPHPHVPASSCRRRNDHYAGIITEVRCSDNAAHEFINEGVPQETLPKPLYSACPRCKAASAPLIATVGIQCGECQMEDFLIRVAAYEKQEGLDQPNENGKTNRIIPVTPDWAGMRAASGYRDVRQCGPNRRGPWSHL